MTQTENQARRIKSRLWRRITIRTLEENMDTIIKAIKTHKEPVSLINGLIDMQTAHVSRVGVPYRLNDYCDALRRPL